jgi:hypothetical protein
MGILFGIVAVAAAGGLGALAWQHQRVQGLEAQAKQADAAARVAEAAVEKMELEVIMRALDQARAAQQMLLFVVILLILAMLGIITLWIYTQYHNHQRRDQSRMEQLLQWLILRELRGPALSTDAGTELQQITTPRRDGAVIASDDPFWAR